MKTPTVPAKTIVSSPCGPIAEKILIATRKWASLQASLRACFISTGQHAEFTLDPFSLLRLLAQVRSDPQFIAAIGEETVSSVEAWAENDARAALLRFDEDIRRLCEQQRISIDGRFPSYTLDGFLAIMVSLDDKGCTIASRHIDSLFVGRIWTQILTVLKDEKARRVEPDVFLQHCYCAYKRAIAIRSVKVGVPLPIRAILREIVVEVQPDAFWRSIRRANFLEYGEEYFRRDLSRLMQSGPFVTAEGAKIELTPTAFSKDGVPIHLGDGVRYIGHMAFVVTQDD